MALGLLTGAEPTLAALEECIAENFLYADETDPERVFSIHCWMTRQFFRSTDGRDWRLITNW